MAVLAINALPKKSLSQQLLRRLMPHLLFRSFRFLPHFLSGALSIPLSSPLSSPLIRKILVKLTLALCCTSLILPATASAAQDPVYARLAWSTMITLDNANRTGDYSVLHALSAPNFQTNNTVGSLYDSFRSLRENQVDIGRAILINPTFYIPPAVDKNGLLRLRGGFETRPMAIRFDILFERSNTGWHIFALSVIETESSTKAPR